MNSGVSVVVCFNSAYNLSLYLIGLIMPLVIQLDFLCLCLWNLTSLTGKCLLIAANKKHVCIIISFYYNYIIYFINNLLEKMSTSLIMFTDFFQKEVPGELQNSLMGLLKTVILYLFYE